jgi:hypothetical protein
MDFRMHGATVKKNEVDYVRLLRLDGQILLRPQFVPHKEERLSSV